jgi:hypothetical protein
MDTLTAALACAAMLTGLPGTHVPLPHWEQRALTRQEQLHTDRPEAARALYDWRTKTIISPPNDWPALVHEMVHHLEFANHYHFSESRAESAELYASSCWR